MNHRTNKFYRFFTIPIFAVVIFASSGCAPLTRVEETQYAKLLNEGIVSEPIQKKQKWAAGTLDFLVPGVGHFYLGEWSSGTGLFLSNIFWPLSPFWASPTGVAATESVNKRYTVEYYTLGEGQQIVASKLAKNCLDQATNYISIQKLHSKNVFSQNEITQYLFLQNCPPDFIKDLDWQNLETTTDSSISRPGQDSLYLDPAALPEDQPKG